MKRLMVLSLIKSCALLLFPCEGKRHLEKRHERKVSDVTHP